MVRLLPYMWAIILIITIIYMMTYVWHVSCLRHFALGLQHHTIEIIAMIAILYMMAMFDRGSADTARHHPTRLRSTSPPSLAIVGLVSRWRNWATVGTLLLCVTRKVCPARI